MARRHTSTTLVGRTSELERYSTALRAANEGAPTHLIIGGEAGVGKTRLLAAFAEQARATGARYLAGGCVSVGDTGLPFAPYTEILRSLVAEDGVTKVTAMAGRGREDLARILPVLGGDAVTHGHELWAQARLYEAILGLLRRFAEHGALVVQLEDLHWADAGTLAATTFLLRNVRDEPILIVATYREDEVVRTHPLRAWLAEALRLGGVERLVIDRLDVDEVAELVANITGAPPDAELATAISQRTDGNPYFVEELIARGTAAGLDVPETLRDVLLSRVDALSDQGRRLIRAAAVGGRESDAETLLRVVEGATGDALRELVEAALLEPANSGTGDLYAFRHALLQEAVYGSLLPHERRDLHRRFAEVLEAAVDTAPQPVGRLVELAHHWQRAGDDRALRGSIIAGAAAMDGFSFDIAVREYQSALELWESVPPAMRPAELDHVELLSATGRAAVAAAQHRVAEAATRSALEELGSDADVERRTELTVQLARILWLSGQHQASIQTYEAAYETAPQPPSIARVRAISGLGQVSMLFGRYRRAVELTRQAVELARTQGLRELEGHAMCTLGPALAASGDPDAGRSTLEEALAIALELRRPDDIGRAYVNGGDIISFAAHPGEALEFTINGIEVLADWGVEATYGPLLRMHAVRFGFDSGAWKTASEMLAEVDRSPLPDLGVQLYNAEYTLPYRVASGHPEAGRIWRATHRFLRGSPAFSDAATPYAAAVEMAAHEERLDEAVALAREGIEYVAPTEPVRYLADLARVAAWPIASAHLQGASDDKRRTAATELDRLAEEVERVRTHMADPPGPLGALLELDHAQILAERERSRGTASVDAWRELGQGWRRLGYPYPALYVDWRTAEAAHDAGDRDTAIAVLRSAFASATELGAVPMARHLQRLARRLRIRLDGPAEPASSDGARPSRPAYGLTKRELEVLGLVAAGRTNRQIAEELYISESTAGVHVSNLMGKLGVNTRTEAARLALDEALVGS